MSNEHLNVFDALRKNGIAITPEQEQLIMKKFREEITYTPKVAIFGKTGAGKSSLTNALFGEKVCEVNDVERCTVKVQEINIGGMILYDCPGIGESETADENYIKMYNELLPKMDAILWVIKGDDRSFTVDLQFYQKVVSACIAKGDNKSIPLYFVLNQVDKIEPFRKWDEENHVPGSEQIVNIQRKIQYVSEVFSYPINKVIGVSACENYNLVELVNTIIMNMPKQRVSTFWGKLNQERLKKSTATYSMGQSTSSVHGNSPKPTYEDTEEYVRDAEESTFVKVVKTVVKTAAAAAIGVLLPPPLKAFWNIGKKLFGL